MKYNISMDMYRLFLGRGCLRLQSDILSPYWDYK